MAAEAADEAELTEGVAHKKHILQYSINWYCVSSEQSILLPWTG